jgi:Acyl-protein synthetase, LuxE
MPSFALLSYTNMAIYDEVLAFIHTPQQARFDSLALEVFRHQFDTIAPYRDYCLTRGVRSDDVRSLDEIPALSTTAFKYAELTDTVTFIKPAEARIFMTSGTTAGRDQRGRHRVPRVDIYRASALGHLRTMLFPDGVRTRMLSLHPTADRMPESSLSQMISWTIQEFGIGDTQCVADSKGIDIGSALEFLRAAERQCQPVCVMATTAALGALFEELRPRRLRLALAPGSRLMDTGGAKGQTVPLGPREVVEHAQELLGIDPAMVINEYGMTEMCSQLYDVTSFNSLNSRGASDSRRENSSEEPLWERSKLGPAWLDVAALDPSTLKRVPDGNPGLLRFFDLANVGSVSAILTGDLGIVQGGTVKVLGRAEDGEARGCALGIEQFAARES